MGWVHWAIQDHGCKPTSLLDAWTCGCSCDWVTEFLKFNLINLTLATAAIPATVKLNKIKNFSSSVIHSWGFPGGSDGKESAYNVGDLGLIPGLGRSPGGGHSNPLQYSCLENPHGQRSLVGCSPCDGKELDMNEQLNILESYHVSLLLNSSTFS